jgi:hypothetical protein
VGAVLGGAHSSPDAGEQLSMALDWLPKSIATRLGFVHFCIGDPVFAGLHEFEVGDDGGSYRTAAQYVSECCQTHRPRSARRATIVLPLGQVERQRSSPS